MGGTSRSTPMAPAAHSWRPSFSPTSSGTFACPWSSRSTPQATNPGVGWVVFRDAAALPDDLVVHVSYLGGDMIDFSINFSRPGSQVIAQYYSFLRMGMEGYTRI